jgi:hypothetical protein
MRLSSKSAVGIFGILLNMVIPGKTQRDEDT